MLCEQLSNFPEKKKAIIYESLWGNGAEVYTISISDHARNQRLKKYMKTKGSKQMYPIQIVRKVDELGRIVLPLEFRRKMSVDQEIVS